jgi:cytochrome c553
MKRTGFKALALVMVVSIAPEMAWVDNASVRDCTWCHGTSAQGYMVAPRLAGQRPAYIESQIRSFREHTRDSPFSKQYMWSAVAALDARSTRELADYLATIAPKPANDGDRNLATAGRTIYMEGIPEANIASCYACHGPNAAGVREIPRLGGLAYFYPKARLQQWGQGYHSHPASPMPWARTKLRRWLPTSACQVNHCVALRFAGKHALFLVHRIKSLGQIPRCGSSAWS